MSENLNWDVIFPDGNLRPDKLAENVPLQYTFPKDFLFGVATAAYQIEGAASEDGRGESIWDRFAHTPGKIKNSETGDIACDHYHRWREDVELMKLLHLGAYRMSISWSRVLPNGRGPVNQAGLDFYSRVVDGLLEANITPFVTLFHWDLPQALQDTGGWTNRETCDAFADYALLMFETLGDRVKSWITFNEPPCIAVLGYGVGAHAPGLTDWGAAFQVSHNVNVAHGLAVQVARNVIPDAQIGIAENVAKNRPSNGTSEAVHAADMFNKLNMSWYLDPIFKGEYPSEIIALLEQTGLDPEVEPDDLRLISQKIDFLGLNYYFVDYIVPEGGHPLLNSGLLALPQMARTNFNWKITPEGLFDTIEHINQYYKPIPIYITENGLATDDRPDDKNVVRDDMRILYTREHLVQLHRALQANCDVRGYFHWTLLDNFEWAEGYSKRFGLIRTVAGSLERVAKKSALWYAQVARDKGII